MLHFTVKSHVNGSGVTTLTAEMNGKEIRQCSFSPLFRSMDSSVRETEILRFAKVTLENILDK